MIKKLFCILFILSLLPLKVYGAQYSVDCPSAVLIEQKSGKVLFSQNSDEKRPPASVTKVMTLLLIYEAVEEGKLSWDEEVTVSEHVAGMGGSQIFLEPGEKQTVKDLTKSVAIASANDAAVAMAERIGGSESDFVTLMNEKAKELGMNNTNFENACGLDSDNHYTTAYDIALMSRELLNKYPEIKDYTTTWQDTITHTTAKGQTEFGLTNTNKLIKQYSGATGLKTGSTSKALYCLSGSAERDGMELIGVIMAAPDPKARFKEMAGLLDYGFGSFSVLKSEEPGTRVGEVSVYKGKSSEVSGVVSGRFPFPLKKMKETSWNISLK
ncbi:MAG: D-alanyl-D-alanine carboxypeptidase [Clostridiales bacterium]|nr:D-alanyl-D-alanine carboxypeptidase [Clostridiales bacterium]